MKREKAYFAPVKRTHLAGLLAVLAAFAIFAFNHGRLMTELGTAPEVYYAESEESLYEKLNGCFGRDKVYVSAIGEGSERLGAGSVAFKLFGAITLKRIPVFISERTELLPGGDPVGISIYTEGVLLVGLSGFTDNEGRYASPAEEAGLCAGDVIRSVNGVPVATSLELQNAVDSASALKIEVERNGKRSVVELEPRKDAEGRQRIGAWVRDSTVGIGTLSFADPASGVVAALGHAVIDPDTGTLLKAAGGKLVIASILGVTKGRQGSPGELHGTFGDESPLLGSIDSNTELGIFGTCGKEEFLSEKESVPVAFPDEVHTGGAYLLSAASGRVESYSCRIIKTGRQNEPAPKGLVIEIDDEALTELTGGIVQGMSGSPVFQDGRLVGVITHVFVNDPLKGYGAYAYWMYKVSGGDKR